MSSRPLDYFQFKNGELTSEGVPLEQLAKEHGTPLYVYSENALLDPIRRLKKVLSEIKPLICFAVKANSNLSILKVLAAEEVGMDLVSIGELRRALHAGVRPEKIVFSGVGKSISEISEAIKYPLHSFNAESVPELELINEVAGKHKKRAKVALRFNPDVNPKTHPYISTGLKQNKFGLNRDEIITIAKHAAKKYPNVDFRGLSIHIGSQILTLNPFKEAFQKIKDLAIELDETLPEPLEFLDLGGGLGIGYKNEKPQTIENYGKLVLKFFGKKSDVFGRYRILFEPGRTVAGNAGVLISRVLYRKKRKNKDFLILDAAMNDLMRPALYQSYHEIVPLRKFSGKKRKVDVVGPVCESADCFGTGRLLPEKITSNDFVAILSAGAYGMSMASNYNTRNRPAEALVKQGVARIIRRRESFEDLIRLEKTE